MQSSVGNIKRGKRERMIKAILISVLVIMSGILELMTEFEKSQKTRVIFLLVASILFFIAGFFTGVHFN